MKLLLSFTTIEFRSAAIYRVDFWMWLVGNFIGMYGAYWLWTTLYHQRPGSFPVSLGQMITYGLLAMILNVVLGIVGAVNDYIRGQVRTGAMQMDLLRPLNFQMHMLLRSTGQVLISLVTVGLPGAVLGSVFLGMRPPASAAHGLLFLASLVPAFLIAFALIFLLGMISIYTIEARRISWVYHSIVFLLSGQFVPLWVFPPQVGQVVALLPFQGIIGTPVSIYIGRFSLAETAGAVALQLIWAAGLLVLGQWVWQKAYTRLTVQGG